MSRINNDCIRTGINQGLHSPCWRTPASSMLPSIPPSASPALKRWAMRLPFSAAPSSAGIPKDYPADMSCHIRDPKVLKKGEYYYMVLGARDALSKGMVLVYRSMDLTNWEYFNRITTEQTFGYMWECPDLFCLDGRLCLVCCPQGVNRFFQIELLIKFFQLLRHRARRT